MINVTGLASLLEQASRSVHSICYAHGLHPAQWSALRYFAKASARARTVSGLAHYQGTTLAPASRTLSALVRKGYLIAVVDPNDRRSRTMELTEAGRALLDQDPLNDIAALLGELSETDQAALAQALESFLDSAAKSTGAAGEGGGAEAAAEGEEAGAVAAPAATEGETLG